MRTWVACIGMGVCLTGGLLLPVPDSASAADASFKPFVAVSEEMTDNLYEDVRNRHTEYITRVRPGATLRYLAPVWTWDAAYTFEYRTYARNSKENEYTHDATLKGTVALIENFLHLDLADTYHRVPLDVSRDPANESSLFLNQTDQNIATVSPYLLWRLRGDNTLKTGYRFIDTRYWDPFGINKQEHRGFADLTHDVSSRLGLLAGYSFTRLESLPTRYDRHDVYGGFKYEYAEKSFVSCQIGNSWQQFDSGLSVNYLFWNAVITHDLRFAVATLATKVVTTEDPLSVSTRETNYSGKLEKELQRGMMGLSASYSEYVNTVTDLTDRRRFGVTLSGGYEIVPNLTASIRLVGERFNHRIPAEYPYRYSGVAGLSYAFKNELTLGLTYTYVNNLLKSGTTSGSNQVNKAVIELKKAI